MEGALVASFDDDGPASRPGPYAGVVALGVMEPGDVGDCGVLACAEERRN